jgi:glycosyltransferase involved in cell wall biosynthesis
MYQETEDECLKQRESATRKMTILFVAPLLEPITGQSLASGVLLDWLRRSHNVTTVNITRQRLISGVDSFGRIKEVAMILLNVWRERKHADVIYLTISESVAGNIKDLLIYTILYNRLSRVVVHLHGGAGMKQIMSMRAGVLRFLNSFFWRRLGGVIVLGETHSSIFERIMRPDKIYMVPNFSEDYLFLDRREIERKFNNTHPFRVLFLSNFLPGKGHDDLLKAYMELSSELRESIAIDLAGGFEDSAGRAKLEQRLIGLGNVTYHGVVSGTKKRDLFAQAHLFCLPTYYAYEGQPISILEAYAAGCVVVTTAHSGIPDIFRDGINGYLVAERTPGAIAEIMKMGLRRPDEFASIGAANHDLATKRYRVSIFVKEVGRILERVCKNQ